MKKSSLIGAMSSHNALTQNGALTHSTTQNKCVDFFSVAGATRRMSADSIISLFLGAYTQDKNIAWKILFWARDAREGSGERNVFHTVMKYMRTHQPHEFNLLYPLIPEYGYFKDLFIVTEPDQNNLSLIAAMLTEHPNKNLLAKWFPRKGKWFTAMHKFLAISPKTLRKTLVGLTNVVETAMCNKEWSKIVYSQVPSQAMNRYRKSFFKRDGVRFNQFVQDALAGKTKINASVVYPNQLYNSLMSALHNSNLENAVMAQWNNLPDYMAGSTERILPLCDVSGSMSGEPMEVSVSLGLYISERNQGIFKDAFITFSESPELVYLQGNLVQRAHQLQSSSWGYNTNLQKAFDLILESAVRNSVPQDEMPTKLLVISDMEFDQADGGGRRSTNLETVRVKYQRHGYEMPQIIFWNVKARSGNCPANINDQGIGLVSGYSPSILKSILKGQVYGPEQLMLDTIMVPRYEAIKVE